MSAKNIEDIIEEAWGEAENENSKEAIKILEQAIKDFPEKEELILLQLAQIYFRERQDLKALELFMNCYNNSKSEEILQFLLYCYYEPNVDDYKKMNNSNIEYLKNYKYFYGDIGEFKEVAEKILWYDKKQIISYRNQEVCKIESSKFDYNSKNKLVILINEFSIDNILLYEKATKVELNVETAEVPMYLYYDEQVFSIVTQLLDFSKIVKKNHIVIIVGKKQLEEFFSDTQAIVPNYAVGERNSIITVVDILENCSKEITKKVNEYETSIRKYYKTNSLKILENIKNENPSILFITTRFSTAVQYHTRDCMNAAQEMGLKTELYIEKSDIHRETLKYQYEMIFKLKPDIIFCVDHFRFEYPDIPKEAVWINWVQDPLEHIMDKNTPNRLSDRDFVLNHVYTWQEFKDLKYPEERLFDAPIPSNPTLYKPYELSKEEKEKYSCDICFVCHAANFEEDLNNFLSTCNDSVMREYFGKMAYEYYNLANNTGKLYYSKFQFKEFFSTLLNKWCYAIEDSVLDSFVEGIYMWSNQRIFRQLLVNWLIDAGYENIKLWGNGWMNNKKYKKYAMGPAQNGEILSKIYQCSKINVGNNILTTSAARAWESMLSGGFYMANYIPEEDDISDMRKILQEDEYVMFYDKDDFLAKIKYYLEHEDERLKMIEIGRKCALERMTFEVLMKKTVKNIAEYYRKRD